MFPNSFPVLRSHFDLIGPVGTIETLLVENATISLGRVSIGTYNHSSGAILALESDLSLGSFNWTQIAANSNSTLKISTGGGLISKSSLVLGLVSYVGIGNSKPSIILVNCLGTFSPHFPEQTGHVYIQGGKTNLIPSPNGFAKVYASNNAVIIPDFIHSRSRPATLIIRADLNFYDSSEFRVAFDGPIFLDGSLRFYDTEGRYSLHRNTLNSIPVLVSGNLTLKETNLILNNYLPRYAAYDALSYSGKLVGRFSEGILIKTTLGDRESIQTRLYYDLGRISVSYHAQVWPGIGWGAFAIIALLAIGFAVGVVFLVRKVATRISDENGPLAFYSPVTSTDSI